MSPLSPHPPHVGRHIVVTRDAQAAGELAAWLAPDGVAVVPLPLTRIVPATAEEAEALAALAASRPWPAAVAASRHAAAALARALAEAGAQPARLVAVGDATRRELARHRLAAEVPARADASGLAAHLLAGSPPAAVLWPRAAEGRTEGVDLLRAAGVEVVDPVAYRTEPVDADDPAVQAGLAALWRAAAVCVYAPSQVEALHRLGALVSLRAPLVAVGATTAAAVAARGAAVAATAAAPDAAAMARAVVGVLPRRP